MKKKIALVKGIISYIFALLCSVIFALFLDANVGWFILLALILAPVISVLFAWLSSKMVGIDCEIESMLLAKGDSYTITVKVNNKGIFPTPPMDISLVNQPGVSCENSGILVSVMPRTTRKITVNYQAKICGKSMVGVEKVKVTDYLGLFSFSIKMRRNSILQKSVAVIPEIGEISTRDDNILKVMQASSQMDDSEDTIESATFSFGGFPGYDNREYVPGDPLKRINWKQSAKRDKLLVRLDDEIATQSVNVVLDSVFYRTRINTKDIAIQQTYSDYAENEILAKIAENVVENALGFMQVLIRNNYTINFYVMMERKFQLYVIQDEIDLESVRLQLANYCFYDENTVERIPRDELNLREKVSVFFTPNTYEEACMALENDLEPSHTTIYSLMEEIGKNCSPRDTVIFQERKQKQKTKANITNQIITTIKSLVIPYLLALLLSICVFHVFEVPLVSYWTLAQMIVCAGIMALCQYIRKHKVIGTMLVLVLVVGILSTCFRILYFEKDTMSYIHWFMSGGESVKTTFSYLLTILLIFTVFFSMVIYYFTKVLYRTSFLMAVSMIPFVVYVKVIQDINMVHVVFITILNIAAFLVNSRIEQDKGKTIIGYGTGLVSVGLYGVILILIGLAVPEAETKYYYLFENAFLGGNISEPIQTEYSMMSEYSGNADAFNQMNNRKLYVISAVDTNSSLYLKRQTFDLYDFTYDRWYAIEGYGEQLVEQGEWEEQRSKMSIALLIDALNCAKQYQPEILKGYGLDALPKGYSVAKEYAYIETMNFPSIAYITPPNSIKVSIREDYDNNQENTYVSLDGVFKCTAGFLYANENYSVEYYAEEEIRNSWIEAGGANFDTQNALLMLEQIKEILAINGETEYEEVVDAYIEEARHARWYQEKCQENTEQISDRVKKLAQEITKNCTYDWEKADALQNYFNNNGFVYDLSYRAPDDSVEYFLFKGKTGTCSDFASAFTLMARSVGLTVRYAEGFVPEEEFTGTYTGEYVVRTNCGHAYPEVYIPNVGYVVYEATIPAIYGTNLELNSGVITYFAIVAFRVLFILALIATLMIILIFVRAIIAPGIGEMYFKNKFKKTNPKQATVMVYRRIQEKYGKDVILHGKTYTPYEYATMFERLLEHKIRILTSLVEKAAYTQEQVSCSEKEKVWEIYQSIRSGIKQIKKKTKKKKGAK